MGVAVTDEKLLAVSLRYGIWWRESLLDSYEFMVIVLRAGNIHRLVFVHGTVLDRFAVYLNDGHVARHQIRGNAEGYSISGFHMGCMFVEEVVQFIQEFVQWNLEVT